MISKVLITLEQGLRVVSRNSRIAFVVLLLFLFPLLFIWITQSFYTTAYNNILSADKHRVAVVHDSLAAVLEAPVNTEGLLQSLLVSYQEENSDITKIRVVYRDETGLLIKYATDPELIGQYEENTTPYTILPRIALTDPIIFPVTINGDRAWQVFRQVDRADGTYYTFSEHSFAMIDSVMTARRQQSYLGLSAIFLFLIGLAYWINRQTNWGRQHDLLQEQLEERDLFSHMIAHEFRAPLTAIKGYASFLQEAKGLPEAEVRYATNIRTSAERLVVLVNDFLEVARLQSGKMQLNIEPIDIRQVLIAVTEDLRATAKTKGLQLIYKPGAKAIPVTTDQNRLTQVLINIVNNAIKYTAEGSVELACTVERGRVTVRIMDTGMGISAEDQKKLFAPFERVGGVADSQTTGTGLGMYITKKLVALLQGVIGVESIKGVGSHIVIILPIEYK